MQNLKMRFKILSEDFLKIKVYLMRKVTPLNIKIIPLRNDIK